MRCYETQTDMYKSRDIYVFVGAIEITHDIVGATTIALDSIGATTIALGSIGATTITLDYSRFCRVCGLITLDFVGATIKHSQFSRVVATLLHGCVGIPTIATYRLWSELHIIRVLSRDLSLLFHHLHGPIHDPEISYSGFSFSNHAYCAHIQALVRITYIKPLS